MHRITNLLALGAFAFAGIAVATTAGASAANFSVPIIVKDVDTVSNIRSTTSSTIVGFITPATAIAGGGTDPATGTATYSDGLPGLGASTSASVMYVLASDGVSSPCTFTIKVTRDNNPTQPYVVHFTSDATRCTVPGDARSSNGMFAGTFTLNWSR